MSQPDPTTALVSTALQSIHQARARLLPQLVKLEQAQAANQQQQALALLATKPNVDDWTVNDHLTFMVAEHAGLLAAPAAQQQTMPTAPLPDEMPF